MFGLVFALTASSLACQRGGGGGEGSTGEDTGSGSSGSGGPPPEIAEPADACSAAPLVSRGVFAGSLRNRTEDPGPAGACGGGGPDVFLRVDAEVRADLRVEASGVGFAPRLSLGLDDCAGGGELACGVQGPLELRDLAAGTVVRVTLGADPDVFSDLNEELPAEDAPDPLAFELRVGLTRVLGPGEVCEPEDRGRCVDGTLCMASAGGDARVCTTLPGDTCATAEAVAVVLDAGGEGSLTIDPGRPQTDAHSQSCTGAGRRERVLRLELPATPPLRGLEIRAEHPDVGLGLRAPGCLLADEVACAAPATEGARVVLGGLSRLRREGVRPFLFVELPADSEDDAAFALRVRTVPEPQTWGE